MECKTVVIIISYQYCALNLSPIESALFVIHLKIIAADLLQNPAALIIA